jgi:hypothetical protein
MELSRVDKDMRLNVACKKEIMKSVNNQRTLLIKHCSEYGYRKRYNAVMWEEPGIIHNNVPILNKLCRKQNDMHMIKTRKQFTLYVNEEPMLVIRKLSSSHQNGSRWVIEQYSNDKRHRARFQHGYVFILRVPCMHIRMGVFFKAPVHQDFTNFTHHFRAYNGNDDIINHSLSLIPEDEPECGFKYHKLSNNFDLTSIFNDLSPNDSCTKLTPYYESTKNFALHQAHSIYKSKCTSDTNQDTTAVCAETNTSSTPPSQNSSKTNYLYNFYNPSTKNSTKPYIAMTRYQNDLYLTTYNEPVTPAIAFVVSVLACHA